MGYRTMTRLKQQNAAWFDVYETKGEVVTRLQYGRWFIAEEPLPDQHDPWIKVFEASPNGKVIEEVWSGWSRAMAEEEIESHQRAQSQDVK